MHLIDVRLPSPIGVNEPAASCRVSLAPPLARWVIRIANLHGKREGYSGCNVHASSRHQCPSFSTLSPRRLGKHWISAPFLMQFLDAFTRELPPLTLSIEMREKREWKRRKRTGSTPLARLLSGMESKLCCAIRHSGTSFYLIPL